MGHQAQLLTIGWWQLQSCCPGGEGGACDQLKGFNSPLQLQSDWSQLELRLLLLLKELGDCSLLGVCCCLDQLAISITISVIP